MAKGDGSITEVKRGVWRVRVDFGTDQVTGKRNVVSRNVHGSKAEARKVRDRIRREHDDGLAVDAERLTFAEFADAWHESRVAADEVVRTRLERAGDVNPRYVRVHRRRAPARPHAANGRTLYAAIKRDKTQKRGKCSGTTLHMYHGLLKRYFAKRRTMT